MNLAGVVILVLSVVILADLSASAYYFGSGGDSSKRCQYQFSEQTTNIDDCVQGWYRNRCKVKVCYKDEGEECGGQDEPELQLKKGKCGPGLSCCHGKCSYSCVLPIAGHAVGEDILQFIRNVKRKSVIGLSKIPVGQMDEAEY